MEYDAKRDKVYRVFERVSGGYDSANFRISLGLQASWKEMLVRQVFLDAHRSGREQGFEMLDLCCGTGDIAIAAAAREGTCHVTGVDFSPAMLREAQKKGTGLPNVDWVRADVMKLPFRENSFDACTISFGLRNTGDYGQVLREMLRVVRPGGSLYCLESCVVENLFIRPFYTFYFRVIMPLVGGGVKRFAEYRWLWQSTKEFLRYRELAKLFLRTGCVRVRGKQRMFGACVLVKGQKEPV